MAHDLIYNFQMSKVIILPTDTVYGLACLPKDRDALDKVKNQPSSKLVAYVYPKVSDVICLTDDAYVRMAIESLLPGPFTVVFIARDGRTVGVRVPAHPLCQDLLVSLGGPLLLTSANMHGERPAITFAEASSIFPSLPGVDGGPCLYQRPSCIIDLTQIRK